MAEGELEVDIVETTVITTYPKLGEEARTVALTFQYGSLPPLTVWIPEEEDTPERRAQVIRSRIQAELTSQRRTLKV